MEKQLIIRYPNLDIKFNDVSIIGAELDIYIPSLSLAFELNGIFHYEPIYGIDNLIAVQERDKRKVQACIDNDIDLWVIDVRAQIRITDKFTHNVYNIIIDAIDRRLT